ncbi:arylsulfatase [Seiridium cupressi]
MVPVKRVVWLGASALGSAAVASAQINTKPNFVFIMIDDQDLHLSSLDYMPISVQFHLAVLLESLSSLGNLPNVTDVSLPYGGYQQFINNRLYEKYLPVSLEQAVYGTYYTGKLMDVFIDPQTYWYYNASMPRNNATYRYLTGNYSTDVVANTALESLDIAAAADEPFFIGNGGAGYWATLPKLNSTEVSYVDLFYQRRIQSLQTSDELVDSIVTRLEELNILDNTYIIYTSDNGFHIGQHRLPPGKTTCVEEDINVPFVTDPNQSTSIYGQGRNIPGYDGEKLTARLDALLLTLKGCKGRVCTRPWETLHPQGNVPNLTQALDSQYDQFYLEQQIKVSFSECIGGQVLQYEGPHKPLAYGGVDSRELVKDWEWWMVDLTHLNQYHAFSRDASAVSHDSIIAITFRIRAPWSTEVSMIGDDPSLLLPHYMSQTRGHSKMVWPPLSKTTISDSVDSAENSATPDARKMTGHGNDTRAAVPEQVAHYLSELALVKEAPYQPLCSGQTIRILEIHPGKKEDLIDCTFHYLDLRYKHMDYQALSYVWGMGGTLTVSETGELVEKQYFIRCNGHNKVIQGNLYGALEHMRSDTHPLLLWADAICINQDDERERGHQVTLMNMIYTRAARVIIWLGQKDQIARSFWDHTTCHVAPDSAKKATEFDIFQEVPSQARALEDQDDMWKQLVCIYLDGVVPENEEQTFHAQESRYKYRGPELTEPDSGIDSSLHAAYKSRFWLSIADLFKKDWFWRVWVLQEAFLAQSAVVCWGQVEIDWRWVGLAASILRTSYQNICDHMGIGGVYNAYHMFRMSRSSDLPSPPASMTQLLRLTRQLGVTDPRDRLYGLLGIKTTDNDPEHDSLFMPVDYSIESDILWNRVAWKEIQSTNSLAILSSLQHSSEFAAGEETLGLDYTLLLWDTSDSFAASRGLPLHLFGDSDSVSPQVLQAEGITVGTVGYTGKYMWHAVDTSLLGSQHMGPFFASEIGLKLLSHTLVAGRNTYGSLTSFEAETSLSGFSTYLLALHERYHESAAADNICQSLTGLQFQAVQKAFHWKNPWICQKMKKSSDAFCGQAHNFLESTITVCERRRLFLTLNGYLGLAPDIVREGDIVAVLSGGEVPFLLRPLTGDEVDQTSMGTSLCPKNHDPPAKTHNGYRLVGECFVHGLMAGEAVDAVNSQASLSGPVPKDLIHKEVMSLANTPEPTLSSSISEARKGVVHEDQSFRTGILMQNSEVQATRHNFYII